MENGINNRMVFGKVFEEYKDLVYWYARKYTNNSFDAEDMAQEAFFRYYQAGGCEAICKPKGWLAICVKNMALNYQRQLQREVLMDEQISLMNTAEIGTLFADDSFELIWKNEVGRYADMILKALNQHNKRWYDILVLFYGLGMSVDEVAKQLDMTNNAVDCMMRRAKTWARTHFQDEYNRIVEG